MRSQPAAALVAALVVAVTFLSLPVAAAPAADDWQLIARADDGQMVAHARRRADSAVNELRVQAVVAAPLGVVQALITDVDGQRRLFPWLTVSKQLAQQGDELIILQRSETFLMQPRESVTAVSLASSTTPDGRARFTMRWRADARYFADIAADAVNVDLNEGSWQLEELRGGRATMVTFRIAFDPKGSVPPALVNLTHGASAQQVYATIAREAAAAQLPEGRKTNG